MNNPAITVAVILDSAVGLHQGGQVSAPVFQRVAQRTLAYLNVPQDVELPANRQLLLAAKKVKEDDLEESSPDHLGSALELAENNTPESLPPTPRKPVPGTSQVVPAAVREPIQATAPAEAQPRAPAATAAIPSNGTVVLDVEQGGIMVPSFMGKSVRSAIEAAQDAGLELEAVGSGIAREQTPAPGSHVAAGARIVVRFDR